jgi:hypothetical protein
MGPYFELFYPALRISACDLQDCSLDLLSLHRKDLSSFEKQCSPHSAITSFALNRQAQLYHARLASTSAALSGDATMLRCPELVFRRTAPMSQFLSGS